MKLGEVLTGIGRANAYYPSLTKVTKNTKATLFLSQLCYWEGRQQDRKNRWIYKSAEELELETGLTRREQEGARKTLKALGILQEMYARTPRTLHFRVDFERLEELWDEYEQAQAAMHQKGKLSGQDGPMHQKVNLHSTNGRNYIRQNGESNTEITAEITAEKKIDDSLRSSYPADPEIGSPEPVQESDLPGKQKSPAPFLESKALSRDSKYPKRGTGGVSLDTVVSQTAKRSTDRRNAKPRKPRKVPQNANTIISYFGEVFQETLGGKAPLELGKDRKLMRQMIEHYGYDTVKQYIDWMFRHWAQFRRECNLHGVPTVGMLYGFRGYLQEQTMHVSPSTEIKEEKGGTSVWGV